MNDMKTGKLVFRNGKGMTSATSTTPRSQTSASVRSQTETRTSSVGAEAPTGVPEHVSDD
jgi:hypothetical protein